ncbi:hypothetical protein DM860_005060 [Cuscuta australis]|uniref:DNA-directed RNA polymerase n=1 Tax=Cuscuta australis TaxID=267555 RepID=A0A328DRC4_9ASTE|nr:hypothetical protein DM860_005060 [Cuscuta australis]
MSSTVAPLSLSLHFNQSIDKPSAIALNPSSSCSISSSSSPVMWRNASRQISSKASLHKFSLNLGNSCHLRTCRFIGFSKDSFFREKLLELKSFVPISCSKNGSTGLGFCKIARFLPRDDFLSRPGFPSTGFSSKSFASVAEAVEIFSSETEESAPAVANEVEVLLAEMRREDLNKLNEFRRKQTMSRGMGVWKYVALKRRQVKIETEAWEKATKEYRELLEDMCAHNLAPNLPYMKSLFLGWFEPLCKRISEEQQLYRDGSSRAEHLKYIDQLPADMIAVITMHKVMGSLMAGGEHGSAKLVHVANALGDAIEQEVRIHRLLKRKKQTKGSKDTNKSVNVNGETSMEEEPNGVAEDEQNLQRKVTNLIKKNNLRAVRRVLDSQDHLKHWEPNVKVKVGSHLVELILQTAYIQPQTEELSDGPPDVRPAFVHTSKTVSNQAKGPSRRYGVIQCDLSVLKGLERSARHMLIPYMPMLIPPIKWKGYDKGAHLYLPSYVMRTHGARQQREALKRAPRKQLESVYEALDTLGSTRWRINKRVLSVVDRIWSSGGRLAGLVSRDDIPLPDQPDSEDETVLKKWKWKVGTIKKENRERHSQRCDIELKLAVAHKMKDEEGFFYPHNLDFRGRAYPMHAHLNHLGSDICRGVLEFGEGRPLGKSGLRWLKIHLANLYACGVDKLSLDGRIAFTENHVDDIFDSADKPLEGKRWWLKAEDPFQCLAACINLAEALRSTSPEATISHVPVHQDGSCNGLQHYAALGRDQLGAVTVNLVAGEKPADVYSGIAARVLDIMKRDAQEDPDEFPDALHARRLINQVDRKLVKQTVMTSVYGVTYIGARNQIKRRLKERGVIEDDSELFGAACYGAKVTLTALGEMFEAARGIMGWLGDCAKIIASENQPVRWTTPLGLPVVQPYRKLGSRLVKTSLQVLTLQRETETIMVKRQRTAFPPNFVHSLDGSHMMMTAVACKRAGLRFAGVHDSYWTHACDVDEMSKILREKFVELYEKPILEDLLESFQQSFPTLSFPPLPERGDFDLKDVLGSPYFFN